MNFIRHLWINIWRVFFSILTLRMILATLGHRCLTNIPAETGTTRATNEMPKKEEQISLDRELR